jgi:hypothetical protein
MGGSRQGAYSDLKVEEMEKAMTRSVLTGVCLIAMLAGCASAAQNKATPTASLNAADRSCPTTGSRLPPDRTMCPAGVVRNYSGEELRQTGRTDVGQALQMLDPAISASGGR